MEYNKWVAEMEAGDDVEGFYILKSAQIRTSNTGKTFLAGSIADRSGTMEIKIWDYAGPLGTPDEGGVVKLRGSISEYRGAPQLIVSRIRLAEEGDSYSLGELVPTAPIDASASWQELLGLVESIRDPDYRAVCQEILQQNGILFQQLPGGKSVHHSFLNGLLMHTLYMARTAVFFAELYQEVVDRDLLLAGTVLHDVAKCREFVTSPLGLVTEYSVPGELLGHLVMGAQAVAETAKALGMPEEKSLLLQHLILSHHGEPDFGAAVRPMCAEAELLYLIDLADSRMEIYKENLEETDVGTFTKRIFALDKKIYRHR